MLCAAHSSRSVGRTGSTQAPSRPRQTLATRCPMLQAAFNVSASAAHPRRRGCSSQTCRKPARKASPAPVASTTLSAGSLGTSSGGWPFLKTSAPSLPFVTTTMSRGNARHRAPGPVSSSSALAKRSASVLLTMSRSTSGSSSPKCLLAPVQSSAASNWVLSDMVIFRFRQFSTNSVKSGFCRPFKLKYPPICKWPHSSSFPATAFTSSVLYASVVE
mmetsp:Transcript_36875/g.102335  ORF Transcript_36875/g.102335 Transcript_36875/m.102335 type:complete len:217 (-) Transcript_36875:582-1232(-)